MWPSTTSRYRAEHAEKHASHTRGLAGLRTDLEALSDYHTETSDAAEASIKALEKKVAALHLDIEALRARVLPVAAESTAPQDLIKPAVKRATSRAKNSASANGETGTTTSKGTGTT